jgi:hypothetical protein
MKKIYGLLCLTLLLGVTQANAQQRYLDPIYAESDIEVTSDVTYATNIDFLTSKFENQMQVGADLQAIKTAVATGQPIPATHYNPTDGNSVVKVTDIKMDVYKAKSSIDTETDRPVVLYLHTGNFLPPPLNGSPTGLKTDSCAIRVCTELARRGYVAISVDYRLGWNPLAETTQERRGQLLNAVYRAIHDVKQAVIYLREDADASDTYGIDGSKIALWGEGTGSYVALAYATLDKYSEMELTKFINPLTTTSYIDTGRVGRIDGSGGLLNLYGSSSTSTEVSAVVAAGGALADTSWMEAGDAAMISFHCVRDPFAPFEEGTVIVPTTNGDVVDVQGGNLYIQKAVQLGNNASFENLASSNAFTSTARARYGMTYDYIFAAPLDEITVNTGVEGLFPIIRPLGASLFQNQAGPWQWWDPESLLAKAMTPAGVTTHVASLQSNPTMSPAQGRAYVDTLMGYGVPRLSIALGVHTIATASVSKISEFEAQVAPNPAYGNATVHVQKEASVKSISLYNINGQLVKQYTNVPNEFSIDLNGLSSGVFNLQVETNLGNWNTKLIVQ